MRLSDNRSAAKAPWGVLSTQITGLQLGCNGKMHFAFCIFCVDVYICSALEDLSAVSVAGRSARWAAAAEVICTAALLCS